MEVYYTMFIKVLTTLPDPGHWHSLTSRIDIDEAPLFANATTRSFQILTYSHSLSIRHFVKFAVGSSTVVGTSEDSAPLIPQSWTHFA